MPSLDVNNIFSLNYDPAPFADQCMACFRFQYAHNEVYRQWCSLTIDDPGLIKTPAMIPALPVSFFKNRDVTSTAFTPELVFESSGTTGSNTSRHLVKDAAIYQESFMKCFGQFYGNIRDWCIIGLLPSYLERQHSSLVMMVDRMIQFSKHTDSGFYLDGHEKLAETLLGLEKKQQKTLLIGVTFALLDFASSFPMPLVHTVVLETGGMKGRRKELTREEIHNSLIASFGIQQVHSEYGMTEMLSQAYSCGNGLFRCPPWMRVMVRDEDDPMLVRLSGTGILQIIDLANVYSCAFIATEDVGCVYEDGSFEVWGRLDNSDRRGCSLLVSESGWNG